MRTPIRRSRHQIAARSDYQRDVRTNRELARAEAWAQARARHPHLFR